MSNVNPGIVSQHAQEAAFLWTLRARAIDAPHYLLKDLNRLDNRVEAHIDGLRVAGEAGWGVAVRQLEAIRRPGEAFVAAVLALESGKTERIEQVLAVAAAQPKITRGVVSALGWVAERIAVAHVTALFAHLSPAARRIAIAAAAVHRMTMIPALQAALADQDFGVRARALRAVGEFGAGAYLPALRRHVRDADPESRFWACWSAARLGDKSALGELQLIAQAEPDHRAEAVNVAIRSIDPVPAQRWLATLAELPGGARLALRGFGWLGDPAAMPRLLEAMKIPALARLAGEAFVFITGVDLDSAKLTADKPEGFEASPNDDPADENVEMDPDDKLPWPDRDKLKQWWEKNRASFPSGRRLLLGKPITDDWLREVLKIGRQRQRASAALELAIREPNKPLFNVKAPGFRQ